MQPLRRAAHVAVGLGCRVVPLVVLARRRQRRQAGQQGFDRCQAGVGGRRRGRPAERRTHQDHRAEHIGPHQGAPRRHRRAEVMADHPRDAALAQGPDQPERIADQVGEPELVERGVEARLPAGGPAIAALVRCHHVVSGLRQRQHQLAPAVGQFGKAVQQQHARAPGQLEAGLQHMHRQAIAVVDLARADARRQRQRIERWAVVHGSLVSACRRSPSPCRPRCCPARRRSAARSRRRGR